jgi:hypothetical protein
MRLLCVLCCLTLLTSFAAAQATVWGGTASNWVPPYGVYAAPFVPLITTPTATLTTVSPSPAGASNATFGLVAGATNATLSPEFVSQPPLGLNTQPVWYGTSAVPEFGAEPLAEPRGPELRHEHKARAFDFIVAPQRQAVAQLEAEAGPAHKASRSYTNQDIDNLQNKTGIVKYDGKTERL